MHGRGRSSGLHRKCFPIRWARTKPKITLTGPDPLIYQLPWLVPPQHRGGFPKSVGLLKDHLTAPHGLRGPAYHPPAPHSSRWQALSCPDFGFSPHLSHVSHHQAALQKYRFFAHAQGARMGALGMAPADGTRGVNDALRGAQIGGPGVLKGAQRPPGTAISIFRSSNARGEAQRYD